MNIIPKDEWNTCRLCNTEIKDFANKYGGNGIYYPQVLKSHIETDHGISLEEYFSPIPTCPCGKCNKSLRIIIKGSNLGYSDMACGRYKGTLEWAKAAKTERCGNKNPMYGKTPWNKGENKQINTSIMNMSIKNTGRITPDEVKKKQSDSAKKRKIHGHTGRKHSQETRDKFRLITLERIRNGGFKQTKTLPHRKMCEILDEINLKYEEEKIVDCWSFDLYVPKHNLYIEVDGDYFHSNPRIYPNGPKTSTQKINWYRDIKKNQFCKERGMNLLRFWECDILNCRESIKCTLKELKV